MNAAAWKDRLAGVAFIVIASLLLPACSTVNGGTVKPANPMSPTTSTLPVAVISPFYDRVAIGTHFTLDGGYSYYGRVMGHGLRYTWTMRSKPRGSHVRLNDPTAMAPSFVADKLGDYVVALVVTTNNGLKSTLRTKTFKVVKSVPKDAKDYPEPSADNQPGVTAGEAKRNWQGSFDFGLTRAKFDDQLVAGDALNLAWGLAVTYKSRYEFGYTSIIDFATASMAKDNAIKSEDGFHASGHMYYLRGWMPLSNEVNIFALAGRPTFTVEATSTYVCLFFCGAPVATTTVSNYKHEAPGLALGLGVGFTTRKDRQLIFQYVDYNHGGDFEFKVFSVSYRTLFRLPM